MQEFIENDDMPLLRLFVIALQAAILLLTLLLTPKLARSSLGVIDNQLCRR
jgi:hypothetical protein